MLPLSNDNLLLVDKPKGISSFDVIRRLRRMIGKRKMGHAGTLDPLATGLLIIGIDRGTKELQQYLGSDKTYDAKVLIGISTETDDMEGDVTKSAAPDNLSVEAVKKVLDGMIGSITIPAPIYSAIKVDGVPLYKHARAGRDVTPPDRTMKIIQADLKNFQCGVEEIKNIKQNFCRAKIQFEVGSGTYIRSLAVEIGRRIGFPATLADLRRTSIADLSIEDAHTLEEISQLAD
ncbi:MAG: tRNA pseudouridine(55) synthase TruB [Candidatus Paceibacterota bacterium]